MKKLTLMAILLFFLIFMGISSPAGAATTSISGFTPNVTSAAGGEVISVSGKGLKSVTKVRVAGVTQSKLLTKKASSFSFKVPRLSSTIRKYGGFVKVEYLVRGVWKASSKKILTTASRTNPFTSAGLTYTLLETGQPSFVPGVTPDGNYYPSSGANLYTSKLNVLNMSSSWIDLTCSFEVDIRVIDSTFRKFSDSGDRYNFSGNPECNNFMNPGFNEDCLFAFDIPASFYPIAIKVQTVSWSGPTPKTYYLPFW